MEYKKGRWSLTSRYLAAFLAPAVIASAMHLTWPLFQHSPVLPYLLAVIFCAWYGGLGPGLSSLVLSLLLTDFFFVEPYFSWGVPKQPDLIKLLFFAVVGSFISVMSELIHKQRRRAGINLNALRASEERYRKLSENFPNGAVITYDRDFRVTFIAGRDLEETGVSADLFMGKLLDEIAPPEVVALVKPHFRAAFEGQTEIYECPFPDGRVYFAAVAPLLDGNGLISEILVVTQNITDRKLADEALKVFRNLIDQSSDAIEVLDPLTMRFLDCNAAAHQSLGYTREEFLSLTAFDIDPLLDLSMMASLTKEMDKAGFMIFESVHRRKDGSEFPIEINAKTIRLERDYRLAVVRDITERKLAEEALRESEERYRIVTETASEAIITIDESSTILFVNSSTEKIFGYSAKDMLGEQLGMLMPEYLRHFHKAGLNHYIETSRKHISWEGTELQGLHKSGREIPLEVSFSEAVQNGHHYFTGIARDVTDRKRAEQALKQSEQHFRNLFEQAHDAIIIFSPDRELVLDVNERACEVYGFTRTEFIGMSLEAISKDVVRGKERVANTLERGDYLNFETVQYRKDGTEMFIEINASTILYQGQLVVLSINRDVTDRKRADEKLQNSEKYFRSLIENASDLITIADRNGIIRYESPSLERMLGYKPEERIGSSVLDLVHPDDLSAAKRHFAGGIRNPGIVHLMECRFQHKNGSWQVLETAGINLLDDPVVEGIVVNSRDITKRKRAEEALRKAEWKYRDIFENAGEGIFQSTPDGRYIAANPALAHMYGFTSPEELIQSREDISRQTYVDPASREEFKRRLREQGAVRGFEHQAFRKDGTKCWISVSARAVRDEQGAVQYYEGTVHDINERKLTEEALSKAAAIVESSDDAILSKTLDGIITSWNKGATRIYGYLPEEIIGRSISILIPTDLADALPVILDKVRHGEVIDHYETTRVKKDGTQIYVSLSVSPIKDAGGAIIGAAAIARDITARRLAEEKLKKTSEQLRALSARLQSAREEEGTRIAREIHDELGSALTTLRWGIEEIGGALNKPLPKEGIRKLRASIQTLTGLIDSTLVTVRRISSELRPGILDDVGLVAAIQWAVRQFEARTGIIAHFQSTATALDLSREQSTAIFRIIQEALTNIQRHAEATSVGIAITEEPGKLGLTIRDNGKGITKERESGTDTLGIIGMRERALLIGGEVTITGTPGSGTVVSVRIPAASPAII